MSLNIRSVNYVSNATENSSNQAVSSNGQHQITVPAGLSASEAGLALLANLREGDVFTGQITNITQNQITLALSENVTINALLADALSYNIGDTASFSVKNNSSEQIVLKSVDTEKLQNLMNDQTIHNALRNAKLSVNETTVSLVHNLMKHGQPIDSASLNHYVQLLEQHPNATVEDIILLTKMDIPVTEENINALHNYYDYSEGMTNQIKDLSQSLQNALLQFDTTPETGNVLSDIVSSFSETISPSENLSVPGEKNLSSLKDMLNMADTPEASQLFTKLENGKITAKEFLTDFADILKNPLMDKDVAHKIIKSNEFKEVINNFMRQEAFLQPEHINHENLKKLFGKILSDNNNLTEKLSANPKLNEFMQNTQTVSGNIEFMNNINHFMSFVQIPVKMSGQNAHGDLYVYKNSRNTGEDKEELKAFLHLDMDNLGPLDVLVTLRNKNVATNFKVANEEILDYIEAHISELNAALKKLGYNVETVVDLNDTPYTFKTNVINQEFPPVEIKRFSFDVRA